MSFYRWLTISIIIHVAIIAPFVLSDLGVFEQPRRVENLRIDLFEVVADRDQEEKKKAGDPLALEEAVVPEPKPQPPAPKPKTEVARIEEEPLPALPPMTEYLAEMTPEEYFIPEIPTFMPSATEGVGVVGGTGTSNVPVLVADSGGGGRGSGGTDDVDQAAIRKGKSEIGRAHV